MYLSIEEKGTFALHGIPKLTGERFLSPRGKNRYRVILSAVKVAVSCKSCPRESSADDLMQTYAT